MPIDVSSIFKKNKINSFELVILSSYHAGRLSRGEARIRPELKGRKFAIMALHDIRDGFVDVPSLYEGLIHKTQNAHGVKSHEVQDLNEDEVLQELFILDEEDHSLKDPFENEIDFNLQ